MHPPRYSTRPLPPYAYLPGSSPHPRRDPSGHSFGRPEPPPDSLTDGGWPRCDRYRHAIDLYNAGFFWECHEELEGLWRGTSDARARALLQALIQAAASHLKWRAGAAAPSARLARKALARLDAPGECLGIDVAALAAALRARIADPEAPPRPIRLRLG